MILSINFYVLDRIKIFETVFYIRSVVVTITKLTSYKITHSDINSILLRHKSKKGKKNLINT